MKEFEFSIFIGRFQPIHKAHLELVKTALAKAKRLVLIIGSCKMAPSPRNPFSGDEREAMIRMSLSEEQNALVDIIQMSDYLYSDNMWQAILTAKVEAVTGESKSIVLIGHEHDSTSYYLKMFPQWTKFLVPNINQLHHATRIRDMYFTYDLAYKDAISENTAKYLSEFQKTDKFKSLKAYFDAIRKSNGEWHGSPHPVIFQTVDAIVIKSGHVLCVRRGKAYGGGQIALPGGFLNYNERFKQGAIRELKEETSISLSKEELAKSIEASHVFDHPGRSERGRTITTAFLFDLGLGSLPKVKGGDDAAKAFWMPLSDLALRQEEFFEDHWHIINYFTMRQSFND